MNHFNATVLDGNMVSTRRGFQVSKHRHNGTAFVNASVQDREPKVKTSKPNDSLPIVGEITFVDNNEARRTQTKTKRRSRTTKDFEKPGVSKPTRAKALVKNWECGLSCSATSYTSSSSISSASSVSRASTPQSIDGCLTDDLHWQNVQTEGSHASQKPLPAWASYKLPGSLSDSSKRLLFMTLAFAPDKSCVLNEYGLPTQNPFDDPERGVWHVQDPTSLHCAITLGALFDAVKSGKQESPGLDSLTSQLCFIINRRLNDKAQNATVRDVTIHAIASLAIIAGYQRKPDHWHVHMRGLLNLIALAGGQESLDYRTITTIRKADLVGAITAATKPCVPFVKLRHSIECSVPQIQRDRTSRIVHRHMANCRQDPAIAETIACVAAFNEYFDSYERDYGNTECDPEALMEHYYFLMYQILSNPEPFRDFDEIISPCTSSQLSLHAQDFPTPGLSVRATDTHTKAIESAMRILVLLYLREPKFDLPCGEEVLLNLLAQHLRTILEDQQLEHIDPSLLHEPTAVERPALIWVCIAGDFFSTSRQSTSGHYASEVGQTSIYKELLEHVLGPELSANPELVSEEDLELCRCLDLRYVKNDWRNERDAIRQILGVIKTE